MNSSSVNDVPEIVCEDGSISLLAAIYNHELRSLQAFGAARNNLNNPAYKAIFKSNDYLQEIITLWHALTGFQPREGDQRRPTFRCINSENEAQHLAPTEPDLWYYCMHPPSMGIEVVGDVLFVCPSFFVFDDAAPRPRPRLCPDVENNEFVESPDRHGFLLDKSIAVTRAMLFYYGVTDNATHYTSGTELQNDILRMDPATTAHEFTSQLLFYLCRCILPFHSAPSSSHINGLMM